MVGPATESKVLLEAERSNEGRMKKKRYGDQKDRGCIQDSLDLLKIKQDDYESLICARCGHSFLYALDNKEEINERNDSQKREYQRLLTKWNNANKNTQGSKPCCPKIEAQTLACMCIRITCRNKSSGIGCPINKTACDNAKKELTHGNNFCWPLTDKIINVLVRYVLAYAQLYIRICIYTIGYPQ